MPYALAYYENYFEFKKKEKRVLLIIQHWLQLFTVKKCILNVTTYNMAMLQHGCSACSISCVCVCVCKRMFVRVCYLVCNPICLATYSFQHPSAANACCTECNEAIDVLSGWGANNLSIPQQKKENIWCRFDSNKST